MTSYTLYIPQDVAGMEDDDVRLVGDFVVAISTTHNTRDSVPTGSRHYRLQLEEG